MSKAALCAMSGPDTWGQRLGHNCGNVGASTTSAAEIPWMETLKGSKQQGSGRISCRRRAATWPFSTITRPTAQAEERDEFAVSKSMAVNFIFSFRTLNNGTCVKSRPRDKGQSATIRTFEALSNAVPVSLSDLAAASVTNTIPDMRELETQPLERGWTLTRAEVIFNDLNLDQLPAFLRLAESQRPPWLLAQCSLTASTRADGCGRVVLIMEAIGKPAK